MNYNKLVNYLRFIYVSGTPFLLGSLIELTSDIVKLRFQI